MYLYNITHTKDMLEAKIGQAVRVLVQASLKTTSEETVLNGVHNTLDYYIEEGHRALQFAEGDLHTRLQQLLRAATSLLVDVELAGAEVLSDTIDKLADLHLEPVYQKVARTKTYQVRRPKSFIHGKYGKPTP